MEQDLWQLVVFSGLIGVSTVFLVRLILIATGGLKEPVLRFMGSYSAGYSRYYPLPAWLAWVGLLMTSIGALVMKYANSSFPAFLPGVMVLILFLGAIQFSPYWMMHDAWVLPRWYREIEERTSRDEQRRISYAWLRLSRPMRRTFNMSDRAFMNWVDLVLLSTTNATADAFVYAPQYRLIKKRLPS